MEYKFAINDLVNKNLDFRRELMTGEHSQVVLMNIPPAEDIGMEVHEKADQILIFLDGTGTAEINDQVEEIAPGTLFIIPAGTRHNFTNSGDTDLKLFTIYAPAQHKPGTIHKTKADAEGEEEY